MRTGSRRRNRPRIAGILAAVAAAVVAVGIVAVTSGGSSSSSSASGVTASSSGGIVRAGDLAPEFRGTATDGSRVDLAALRGRVVLISFFASWCSNCREDLPRVQAAATADAGRGLTVLPVSYLETGDAAGFLRSIGITLPSLIDGANNVGRAYGISSLPVTVWVGRDGRVELIVQGQLTQASLDSELAALLH